MTMGGKKSIVDIASAGLCISCGACAAVCPARCIQYRRSGGMFLPEVDEDACLHCGLCMDACPGRGCDYRRLYEEACLELPENPYAGNCLEAFTAVTRDAAILEKSGSGGVVTTLVGHLLENGRYDCAFLADKHCYADAVHSVPKTAGDDLLPTCKSRYVPVLQTEAIEYMLQHRDARIIFVGVPCFVQALVRIMASHGIDRDRHLIIGLFCFSTMNYNVWGYLTEGIDGATLHFKDKSTGGNGRLCSRWPGDVCVFDKAGAPHFMDRSARTDAKGFFAPERCLYCLDKLNQFADVSVGDNYTGRDAPERGSSSVVVRTPRGMAVKNEGLFSISPSDFALICKSQGLSGKVDNLCFQRFCTSEALLRNTEFPLPEDWERRRAKYDAAIREQALGALGDFDGIRAAIREKAVLKKKHKSLIYKILHFWR